MAFIRWKKNKLGTQQAQLVHSYRDEQGRPRQKVLAHLGANPALTAELVTQLQEKHGHLPIKWDQIGAAPAPKRRDISLMSDEDLVKNLRMLRREYGISFRDMARRLVNAGAPPRSKPGYSPSSLSFYNYKDLERALHDREEQNFYADPVAELAPCIRKVFCSA